MMDRRYPRFIDTGFGMLYVKSAEEEDRHLRFIFGALIFMGACAVTGTAMLLFVFLRALS